jgi:apolipoprotein D and lipocalin family protein
MKNILASLLLFGASLPALAAEPLATIPALDVPRYMGTWYEIAKFPNRFQRKCVANTTATYKALAAGRVEVTNHCRRSDGDNEVAVGEARQVGAADSPKLEVRFAPSFLSFLRFVWGDYWVVDLDPAYQLAAVSTPGRDYLWILSRAPTVDKATYDSLLERLKAKGLDIGKLEVTPQGK